MNNHFHMLLTTADDATLSKTGVVLPTDVVWGESCWDKDTDAQTVSVSFLFKDNADSPIAPTHALTLSGDAWRGLEDMGAIDDLVRLSVLNPDKAQALATYLSETREANWVFTRSLVTMDVTQSTRVPLTGNTAGERPSDDEIFAASRERSDWAVNEGNEVEVYFGDPAEDIEEVGLGEYVKALLAEEEAKRDPKLARIAELEAMLARANAVLDNAAGAICAMDDQIEQMKGMFPDDDDTIAEAIEAGEDALTEIRSFWDQLPRAANQPARPTLLVQALEVLDEQAEAIRMASKRFDSMDIDREDAEQLREAQSNGAEIRDEIRRVLAASTQIKAAAAPASGM